MYKLKGDVYIANKWCIKQKVMYILTLNDVKNKSGVYIAIKWCIK